MILVQPPIEPVASQIRRVLGHDLVVVIGLAEHDPAHVRPECALARGVRVTGLIRFRVMQTVRAHPEHGPAFQRHGAANREKVFEPAWTLIGLMGMQAMIAQTDAPSDGYPMQGECNKKHFPAKAKKGAYRAYVKAHKD